MNSFLLFRQHLPRFQIPNSRDHGTLHNSSTFIILDIPHPFVLVKGNLFGESLFLKVPDSIVVRIGKKVHHIRGGFDIVLNSCRLDILSVRMDKQKDLRYLQMGHKMGAISSNLLIG